MNRLLQLLGAEHAFCFVVSCPPLSPTLYLTSIMLDNHRSHQLCYRVGYNFRKANPKNHQTERKISVVKMCLYKGQNELVWHPRQLKRKQTREMFNDTFLQESEHCLRKQEAHGGPFLRHMPLNGTDVPLPLFYRRSTGQKVIRRTEVNKLKKSDMNKKCLFHIHKKQSVFGLRQGCRRQQIKPDINYSIYVS